MPNLVYLIPGFLSTELYLDAGLSHLLWCSSSQMILGQEGAMRLAADGVSPGAPDGQALFTGAALPEIWLETRFTLQSQLGLDWFVTSWAWDWRKDIVAAGNALAAKILTTASPAAPATLVGHSAGGLLALMAWASLVDSGNTAYVRRIITMGTPFQGSYYGLALINRTDESLQQLLQWNALASNFLGRGQSPIDVVYWTWASLFNLFGTFPAFYQLLPALIGPLAIGDPDRVQLYSTINYPAGFTPSQAWLDSASQVFQPRVANPAYHPPAAVMTCCSGHGFRTAVKMTAGKPLTDPETLTYSDDGDGIVEEASAILAPCANFSYGIDHQSYPLALARRGDLAKYILDPRVPPTPPPPPETITDQIPENVTQTPPTDLVWGNICIGGG